MSWANLAPDILSGHQQPTQISALVIRVEHLGTSSFREAIAEFKHRQARDGVWLPLGARPRRLLLSDRHTRHIASCLQADTLDEMTDILCSLPLGVRRADLGRAGLILFMHADGGWAI